MLGRQEHLHCAALACSEGLLAAAERGTAPADKAGGVFRGASLRPESGAIASLSSMKGKCPSWDVQQKQGRQRGAVLELCGPGVGRVQNCEGDAANGFSGMSGTVIDFGPSKPMTKTWTRLSDTVVAVSGSWLSKLMVHFRTPPGGISGCQLLREGSASKVVPSGAVSAALWNSCRDIGLLVPLLTRISTRVKWGVLCTPRMITLTPCTSLTT